MKDSPASAGATIRGAEELVGKAAAAKAAARLLGTTSTDDKNRALRQIATVLRDREAEVLAANERDCQSAVRAAEQTGGDPLLDRLLLTSARVQAMARDVESVAELSDPIGEEIERTVRPNGLIVARRRVPLGVVGVVYESRPNVTSDIAALCIKTGNGVLLRGGSEALQSNLLIVDAIKQALNIVGLSADAVALVGSTDRGLVERMLKLREYIDVIIPRGGARARVRGFDGGVGDSVAMDRRDGRRAPADSRGRAAGRGCGLEPDRTRVEDGL